MRLLARIGDSGMTPLQAAKQFAAERFEEPRTVTRVEHFPSCKLTVEFELVDGFTSYRAEWNDENGWYDISSY